MVKRQYTFLITTLPSQMFKSTKVLSHIVACINQFSKASPNEITRKLVYVFTRGVPLSFLLLSLTVSSRCSRREETQRDVWQEVSTTLPNTVQVTAKRAAESLFGLFRFS